MGAKLPPARLRALEALDAAEDKRLSFGDFRKATSVKTRAYYPFVSRLLSDNLIVEVGDLRASNSYSLTFAGMRALAAHRAALAKAAL